MAEPEVPSIVRLLAALSRLYDVHQSRAEKGVYVPEVPERAGYLLTLSLTILESLHEIERDRGTGNYPIDEVIRATQRACPQAGADDIRQCIAHLRQPREIRYRPVCMGPAEPDARTWETTPLLDGDERFAQVSLSENARIMLRVAELREGWLYANLDASRLHQAIEYGQFRDIPGFCRDIILDITSRSKRLTTAMERPIHSTLRAKLLDDGEQVMDVLQQASEILRRAIALLGDELVQERFHEWAAREHPGYGIGNLRADLELVLQNIEALSRRFSIFLNHAQEVRQDGAQKIHFLQIAEQLDGDGSKAAAARTLGWLRNVLPYQVHGALFYPGRCAELADIADLARGPPPKPRSIRLDGRDELSPGPLRDALERNRGVVLERLRQGPARFHEILSLAGIALKPEESPADLFQYLAEPQVLEVGGERIAIGLTGDESRLRAGAASIIFSDPVIRLLEGGDDHE